MAPEVRVRSEGPEDVVGAAYQQPPKNLLALLGDAFLGISISGLIPGTSPRYAPTERLLSKR
jgi:hypothetical protein